MLRVLVLGSAAGGGFPQWNCNSEACRRARSGQALPRTQSSVAVTADDENWFLLNASPDVRQQINDNPALHPKRGVRHSPIAGIVLTNGDVDHIAGLLALRESSPLAIYATSRVLSVLQENSIFNVLNPDFVARRSLALGAATALRTRDGGASGLEIEAFAVPGKVALYLEDPDAGPDFGTQAGDTIGLRVGSSAGDGDFFYVPGCAAMTSEMADHLRGARLVLFDGTLWQDDEMPRSGAGQKTGKRMGHMSMAGADGSIAAFRELGVERKIYVHINNTNPVLLDEAPERRALESADWEVAFDGMEICL